MRRKSLLQGTFILSAAGIVVKIVGALYRIPLTALIGAQGMGLYSLVFPIYSYLLVFSTTGIPTAISKLVAESAVTGEGAQPIFKSSRTLLLWIGAVTSVLLFCLAGPIASAVGNPQAAPGIRAIAPALLFVALLSAYRGYFQGMRDMVPTAVSQVTEQVGRLIFGLYLAWLWMDGGVERGAAGALLGVTLSEALALGLMAYTYRRIHKERPRSGGTEDKAARGQAALRMLKVAMPITLGASIMPMVSLVDSALVVSRLGSIGLPVAESTAQLGLLGGVVNTLVYMPTAIMVALQMSLVPSVSQSVARGELHYLRLKSSGSMKLCVLVALPSAVGMLLIAEPMIGTLYRSLTPAEVQMSARLLCLSVPGMVFLCVNYATTAILQGMGDVRSPVKFLALGAVMKIVLNWVLLGIPSVGIYGAPVGTVVCYAVAMALGAVAVVKKLNLRLDIKNGLLLPALSTALMGAAVWLLLRFFSGVLPRGALVLLCILAGIVVYAAALLLTGAATAQDMVLLPKGERIAALLQKMKLLRR